MTSLCSFTSAFPKQKYSNLCFQRVQKPMKNDLAKEMAKLVTEWLVKRQKRLIQRNELFQSALARSQTAIIVTTVSYEIFSNRSQKRNEFAKFLWLLLIAATTILLTMDLLSRTSK